MTATQLRFVGGRYTVEFSVEATSQAHGLEWADLQRVQGALYELASGQGWVDTGRFALSEGVEKVAVNALRIGSCSVFFEVVAGLNLLRVTAVEQGGSSVP